MTRREWYRSSSTGRDAFWAEVEWGIVRALVLVAVMVGLWKLVGRN